MFSKNYYSPEAQALRVIKSTYGDKARIDSKAKNLLKFGRNANVGTSASTIMTLPTGVALETYVASNLITTASSSASGDTESVIIEGHTIDANGDFTFVIQSLTLTGQTQATLTTPLARVTRMYNNDTVAMTGTLYVYEDDTSTAGVPDTDAGVHLMIVAGKNQSEKAATTISKSDYWIITGFYSDVLEKTNVFIDVDLQVRMKGKVFRTVATRSATNDAPNEFHFSPYLIVPPNSDVRLVALSSAANTEVSGGIQGILASNL